MDPWCYPGEKTQAVVVLKSCLQHLLDKSRDTTRRLLQCPEENVRNPLFSKTHPGKASAHSKTRSRARLFSPGSSPCAGSPRRLERPSSQPRPTAQRPPSELFRLTSFAGIFNPCAAPADPRRPHPGGPYAHSVSRAVLACGCAYAYLLEIFSLYPRSGTSWPSTGQEMTGIQPS